MTLGQARVPAGRPPEAPGRGRRRTALVVTLVAGVLAVATAVATTLIVLNNGPQPPQTLADWVREVNSACQRDVGEVEQSFNDTIRQAARLAAEPPAPDATGAAMPGPTEAIDRLAAAVQRLSGDLPAIAFPANGNRDDRQTLLKVSGDIAAAARSLSTAMSAYQTGSAAAGPFQQASVQLQMIATNSMPAWAATITRLGLAGERNARLPAIRGGTHLIIWTFAQAHVAVVATSVSRQATYSWWISNSRVLVT